MSRIVAYAKAIAFCVAVQLVYYAMADLVGIEDGDRQAMAGMLAFVSGYFSYAYWILNS